MDVDVDPFGEHDKKDEASGGGGDETIPLIPRGTQIDPYGGSTWEPSRAETSFTKTKIERVKESKVKSLYDVIIEGTGKKPNAYHFDLFELRGNSLYYVGPKGDLYKELTIRNGAIRSFGALLGELGMDGFIEMGFPMERGDRKKLTSRKSAMLRRTERELPSASDVTKADEIELKEITDKSITSMDDLIRELSSDRGTQTGEDDPDMPTMRELQGLDKELRSIRGSLKVEAAKKVEIKHKLTQEYRKLEYVREHSNYDEGIHKDIKERIGKLTEDLKTREESIDLLKGRLRNQITSFKETITKVLDKDATLGERIRTLFREQGITIFSILTAIGMAIGVLVEALIPGSTTTSSVGGGGDDKKDKPGSAKEWIRNKLKALASLLGKLATKAGAALPGILGSVVAWLLNRAKEVVGWISKNLWSLLLLVFWMVYDYYTKERAESNKGNSSALKGEARKRKVEEDKKK